MKTLINFINLLIRRFSLWDYRRKITARRQVGAERIVRQVINLLRKDQIRPEECDWDSCTLRYKNLRIGVDYGSREVIFNYSSVRISQLLWKRLLHEIEASKLKPRGQHGVLDRLIDIC